MIVIGHSGTRHFFPQKDKPPATYMKPFIQACDIQFAQWVELDISKTELNAKVWNSGKGTIADQFTIVKGVTSPNDPQSFEAAKKFFNKIDDVVENSYQVTLKYMICIIVFVAILFALIYWTYSKKEIPKKQNDEFNEYDNYVMLKPQKKIENLAGESEGKYQKQN